MFWCCITIGGGVIHRFSLLFRYPVQAMVTRSLFILISWTASLGETVVPPLLNISRHRHADYLMLTTSKYHVRIQKLTSDSWTQSCFKETEWYQRCQSWVNMTYLGNDMVAVEITAGNESMSGVFRVYLHCTGASKTCSSDPLMEVTLIIRDKGKLHVSLYS